MPVQMRFRMDHAFYADDASRVARGQAPIYVDPEKLAGVEPARPGDVWRSRWKATREQEARGELGAIAGYAICCSKCGEVHWWTGAVNCKPCPHQGTSSCWNWSGSAEDGTLTASPSLHCLTDRGGCGYHGWLQNGVLSDG